MSHLEGVYRTSGWEVFNPETRSILQRDDILQSSNQASLILQATSIIAGSIYQTPRESMD